MSALRPFGGLLRQAQDSVKAPQAGDTALAKAIIEKHWEVASLCLLLGMLQALSNLPPHGVEGLIEALEGPGHGRRQ